VIVFVVNFVNKEQLPFRFSLVVIICRPITLMLSVQHTRVSDVEMYTDVFGWQPSQCKFPDWMSGVSTWRTLAGNHAYVISDEGDILRRRTYNNSDDLTAVMSFRCLHVEHHNRTRTLPTFVAMTMVHDHW